MRRHRVLFRMGAAVAMAVAVAALSWAGLANSVFFGTQLRFTDALFPSGHADPGIVVVEIDQKSLDAVHQRWPWSRGVHARLVDDLARDGAAWIGYDVTFGQPTTPRADAAL